MAEISADISAKKGSFWIEPLTAYSRVLGQNDVDARHTNRITVCYRFRDGEDSKCRWGTQYSSASFLRGHVSGHVVRENMSRFLREEPISLGCASGTQPSVVCTTIGHTHECPRVLGIDVRQLLLENPIIRAACRLRGVLSLRDHGAHKYYLTNEYIC